MERPVNRRLLLGAAAALGVAPAAAQQAPPRRRASPPPLQPSAGATVPLGIMTANVDGTFVRLGADLMNVLNSPDLRVLPMLGGGAYQNLDDLLRLPGVDLAFTSTDAIAYASQTGQFPGLLGQIRLIVKAYDQELHVVARRDVRSLQDLRDRTVNVDGERSGTAASMRLISGLLQLPLKFTHSDPARGMERLRAGEVDAVAYGIGKPSLLFRQPIPEGFHLVPIAAEGPLERAYTPGTFTHEDYPLLVPEGQVVETVTTAVLLVCFNWAPDSARYANLALFTAAFFEHFSELLVPPRHAKWREVSFAAEVPGLTRFAPAEPWLQLDPRRGRKPFNDRFQGFLESVGQADASPERRAQLMRAFQDLQRR